MIPTVHPTAENGLSKPRASGDDPGLEQVSAATQG